MQVLITGASGFVGRWLTARLRDAGHVPIPLPEGVDVVDAPAVSRAVDDIRPDAVAHLAAVAFVADAAADPATALRIAVAGTINVLEAVRATAPGAAVLVTGSADVYGNPRAADLPLAEDTALLPRTAYALSKVAQESVALAYGARYGLRVVVTRSFNHIGPGQRQMFVVPALAQRVVALAAGSAVDIPVGNLDVRRDMTDVRDAVDAYRRLLESVAAGGIAPGGLTVNICAGRSVAIRWVLEELCRLAEVEPRIRIDPGLVRPDDPPEIRGDPSLIEQLTGWRATTPMTQTLADVWASVSAPVEAAAET
jgi:GDP-4-dehydro-6-deoxy-D-mannose reductase